MPAFFNSMARNQNGIYAACTAFPEALTELISAQVIIGSSWKVLSTHIPEQIPNMTDNENIN
jgi:hypothetical protein